MQMQLKTKTTTIDGMRILFMQLPPRRAFKLGAKLLRHLLPLIAAGKIDIKDPGADMSALLMLSQRLNEDEMEYVLNELLASCTVFLPDGKHQKGKAPSTSTQRVELSEEPDKIDIVFAGHFETMLKAAKESLGVNFELFSKGDSKPVADPEPDTTQTPSD